MSERIKHWSCSVLMTVFLLISLAGCGSSNKSNKEPNPAAETRAKIVNLLEQQMAAHSIPGIVLAIDHPDTGATVIALGVSETENNTPMVGDELFRLGSATKSVVAVTALQLVEEGKLSLSDSVETWLPGLLPDGADITLGQLMNHTAGIPSHTNSMEWMFVYVLEPETAWPVDTLIALAGEERSNPPGTAWQYSNTHYVLVGKIIEAATGNSLRAEVANRFGSRMPSLQVPDSVELVGNTAIGYINWREWLGMDLEVLPEGVEARNVLHPTALGGAGNVAANMTDALTWVRLLIEGELLNPTSQAAAMEWVDIPNTTIEMGRGVVHEPDWKLLGHRGQISGYDCSLQYRYETLDNLSGGLPLAICMNRSVTLVPGASDINELIVYQLMELFFAAE